MCLLSLFVYCLDHAHSMGRVRANRDVQYKYLNPHIIGVVTKFFDQPTKCEPLCIIDIFFFALMLLNGVPFFG